MAQSSIGRWTFGYIFSLLAASLKQNLGRDDIVVEKGKLLLHSLQFLDQKLLLDVHILDKLSGVVSRIDGCRL